MNRRNITNNLKMRIRRYIEYMHEEKKLGSQRGEYLINSLSFHLKDELLKDAYNPIISNINILNQNFSKKFLIKLSSVFKEFTYAPEEIIFNVNFSILLIFT